MARLITLTALCFGLIGCELVADFDRSKIPDDRPVNDAGDDAAVDADGSTDQDASSDEDGGAVADDEDAGR